MLKRKEFILGAAAGLLVAAAATAGGFVRWPGAAEALRIQPSSGVAGAPFAPPPGAPQSFAGIFDQVAPAVVQIDVRTRVPRRNLPRLPLEGPKIVPGPNDLRPLPDEEGPLAAGAGSGFFISADGYIVTNNHVVENAEEILVRLSDNRQLRARLVGRDESTDLAVIKVEGDRFAYVSFDDTAQPRVGDWVIAVGNPFGLGGTATAGIVSAMSRDLSGNLDRTTAYVDFIQIDAAINQGNSGGPTFDVNGRVIGVNTAIFSPTGGSVGIGFAIPAATARTIVERLMRGETIERGYLGVEIGDLQPFREALGLAEGTTGALVNDVTPGGPAQRGGLRPGDVVTALNGEAVDGSTDLTRRVGAARVGDTLRLEILRAEGRVTVSVRAARRPPESELNAPPAAEAPEREFAPSPGTTAAGLVLAPMSAEQRRRYAIPAGIEGVVVTGVAEGGNRDFQPGMVIRRVGLVAARSPADVQAEAQKARAAGRSTIFILVWIGDRNASVAMDLPRER